MLCYKDKTFCPSGDKNSEKCKACDRYFDREAYRKFCEQRGFDVPIAWFVEKPCNEAGTPEKPNFEFKEDKQ